MSDRIWPICKEKLKMVLGETSFNTWLAPLNLKIETPNSLVLEAPDSFFKSWVESNYLPQIKQVLKDLGHETLEISFEVNPNLLKRKTTKIFKSIQKQFREEPQDSFRLNPRFTFDAFVIGSSNRMAHAASLAVANAPGKSYNPLFIYGGVGLGKTHTMQAIAHQILSKNPQTKVKYLSSEKFINELISSIRTRSTEKFRQKYRGIDVLLIDDIQFLAGKEASQEEFFHTFNVLYDAHKQIILSSDRPPKEISRLEDRLMSRFGWGLVVDVQPPDYETRVAILQKKLEKDPIKIDPEVINFIAKNIVSNIRELEGALVRIMAYSLIENKPIVLSMAKDILKDMVKEIYAIITPGGILDKVSAYFGIPKEEIKKGRRNKGIILPRQISMYLIRTLTEMSLPEIGRFFGAKHHTTILYASKKIQNELGKSEKIKMIVDTLSQEIKSH